MNKYKITFTDYVEANTKLEAQENFMNLKNLTMML